jgi:energy-coupling factor transport system permease protein
MTLAMPAAAERAPARGRVAPLLLGAMVGALVAARVETALLAILVAAGAAAMVGAPWPRGKFWPALGFGAAVSIGLNMYLVDGRPLALPALFGREATGEGAGLGALLALRVLGAAIAVHGLRSAWPGERAADEMARWLAPLEWLRVPVREGRVIFALALRFVPLLAEETARIQRLQMLRAGRPARGWRERARRLQSVLVPALTGALERAERVALALEARHYRVRPVVVPALDPVGVVAGALVAGICVLWRS